MPSVDFLGAVMMDESPLLGSLKIGTLKTHKALPRVETWQRDVSDKSQGHQREQAPKNSLPFETRDIRGGIKDDHLRSRTRTPTVKHIAPLAGQSVTPPIDFRDNFKSWIDDKALRDREFLSQQKIAPGNSPLMVTGPPITDDHSMGYPAKNPQVNSTLDAQKASAVSVRTFPESRTDSFKTARENLSSDDESYLVESPSLQPARQRWLRSIAQSQSRDIGLGLGLESNDDESSTPRELVSPEKPTILKSGFVAFDGTWNPYALQELEDADSEGTARRHSEEKAKQHLSDSKERAQLDSPTLGIETRRSSRKEPRGQRRQEKRTRDLLVRHEAGSSRRTNSHMPPIDQTKVESSLHEGLQDMQNIQEKRLSQVSTTSTVVEAIVVEPSQSSRRPFLRHTGKILLLDALSEHPKHHEHASVQSDDSFAKHPLRSFKNADQGLRESFASQGISFSTSNALAKQERSNVVIIPDRRSSLQSSSNSSKHVSRTFSLNSKPQSSRPTTAPENAMGYFDSPQRGRTLSIVIQQATPAKIAERDVSTPEETSSALAAASATKDLFRTTSVTSRGIATHYVPTSPGANTLQSADTHDNQAMKADRSSSGDWTALRPTSALITPYSLRSHSSTPGTLEVNEATAISIYPHTNESILVIQKFAGRDVSSPKEQSTVIAGKARIGMQPSYIPSISQPFTPSAEADVMDSSLQNPRDPPSPPSPPGFKVIPPTPANAASSSEDTVRHVRSSNRRKPFSAPFTSLLRAMSARRYSESSMANPFVFTRTLSLRDTSTYRRPNLAEADRENQLHPLWRPRTYWDETGHSDSSSEFGSRGVTSSGDPRSDRNERSTRRLDSARPNPKRTMSLTRKFADSLRSELRFRPMPRRASTSSNTSVAPGHISKESTMMRNNPSIPKRTQSFTRRLGGSLRLPPTPRARLHRPRRSTTADWNNQPHYEFVPPVHKQNIIEGAPHQPGNTGFQNLAERIERRRSLREESKREERRQVLKGRIKTVEV